MDDVTAGAIQRAVAAAAAGRLREACSIGERALIEGGDVAALNAMVGMFRLRAGDEARAIGHLQLAHAARPGDVRVAANLASALMQQGRNEEALVVASEDLATADRSLQLLRLRGFAAQTAEKFDLAVEAYQRIVDVNPLLHGAATHRPVSFSVSTVPLTRRPCRSGPARYLADGSRLSYARSGEKDAFNSEKESRCAIVLRSSYSKPLCVFAFHCFGGKCFRARVRTTARGTGHFAFRFTRGSGEE